MRQPKNKPLKITNIRFFPKTDLLAQALHEATEKLVEGEGATLRTGGDQVFVKRDMNHQAEILRQGRININKKLKGLVENVKHSGKTELKKAGNNDHG